MEKELYYTNNKLISKLNMYFDLSACQFIYMIYCLFIYKVNLTAIIFTIL